VDETVKGKEKRAGEASIKEKHAKAMEEISKLTTEQLKKIIPAGKVAGDRLKLIQEELARREEK
jgi:hypothetical protein